MKQLIQSKYIIFSLLSILLFTISSCNKDLSISLGRPSEDLGVTILDTLSATTSLVQLEHIPSAGTGSILVGQAIHPQLGITTATSYLRVALTSSGEEIPTDAVFDSINMSLTPTASKYYMGDTTQIQKINIHRVTESIETKSINNIVGLNNIPIYVSGPTIFRDQKFDYDSNPLGSISFQPRIKSIDSLNFKLDNTFGKSIFDLMIAKSPIVSSNENFQQFVKGIAIVPSNQNTAIVGLNDTIYMDINYSYTGSDGFKKTGKTTIVTSSKNYQFNNIEYDRTGTDFAALSDSNREIKSSTTNGKLFLQAGTGVVAKIDFNTLKDFLTEPNMAVNKIELIVEANNTMNTGFPNPNGLMLLIGNKHTNISTSYVRIPGSASIQTAQMVPGDSFGKNAQYTFNLIDYIKTLNNESNTDSNLYLAVSTPNLFGTTNIATIATEDNKPKIKLNIVYTKFK